MKRPSLPMWTNPNQRPRFAAPAPRLQRARAAASSLARTSGSDGALTWEVPPALEPDYGAPLAAAAGAAGDAADSSSRPEHATSSSSGGGGGGGSGGGTVSHHGDPSAQPQSLVGSLAGVHPLVIRARHELAAAARR